MRVFHVTTAKKLEKYKRSGVIKAPVRAWISLQGAENFAKQTGRRVILTLVLPNNTPVESRSLGNAAISPLDYEVDF